MDQYIEKLSSDGISDDENFQLVFLVSHNLNSENDSIKQDARDCIIKILDNWKNLKSNQKQVWKDIVEAVGFYPYLKKLGMKDLDISSEIRKEFHKSNNINNVYFHSKQKELTEILLSKKNVIVSAPTSFGKSLLIEEIVASFLYKNIVIIQPTLALLDETRLKLKKYQDAYKIIIKTSQRPSSEKGNLFLLTAERVMEYENMPNIELLILDEFYKLSSQRGDERASILNNAFLRLINKHNCKFYLLGPNIDKISDGFADKYNALFYKTNYNLVYNNSIDKVKKEKIIKNKVDINYLFEILSTLNDQTLIFCSSPTKARQLAYSFAKFLNTEKKDIDIPLISWIEENISPKWSLINCLKSKIGVHDGALPKHITTSIIEYFNNRKLKYLFCTSTIIEGVNTSAKNVIFYDNKIGTKKVDYFDYSNIKGRAGRLLEHYVGNIINLQTPPEKEQMVIDIPFYDQNPIKDEVLINLPEKDVKDINNNIEIYNDFYKLDIQLQEILKKNGVSVKAQKEILVDLQNYLSNNNDTSYITWSGIPKGLTKNLQFIFTLCLNRLTSKDDKLSEKRLNWLINKTISFGINKSLKIIIENDFDYNAKKFIEAKMKLYPDKTFNELSQKYSPELQSILDEQIKITFELYRKWFQYKLPKWLTVVSELQKYVCTKLNIQPGDYSYYADMLENDFVSPNLRILIEYGIPNSVIEKLGINADYFKSEDQIIEYLKSIKHKLKDSLTEYEFETLNRCL